MPNTEWLEKTEVKLSQRGEIITGQDGATNVEGIFAAGDVTEELFKQIVIAAGSGATAALGAFNFLMRK